MWLSAPSPSSSALGTSRGDRIHHQNVNRFRAATQGFDDFKRLRTVLGLWRPQIVHVDAEFLA